MPDQLASEIKLLRAAYRAFDARYIDAALATMTPDVAWPKAFKGGFVRGPEEIRAYWTEQWREINPHVKPVAFYPEDAGRILVEVHQVVRNLAGSVLADEHVSHRFTVAYGLNQAMEVGCFLRADAPKCFSAIISRIFIGMQSRQNNFEQFLAFYEIFLVSQYSGRFKAPDLSFSLTKT